DFLVIRVVCALLLGVVFWYLGQTVPSRTTSIVSQAIALLPLVSICTMIVVTGGGNSVYYAGLNLIVVGLALLLRWTFKNTLWMILATFVCYTISVVESPVTADPKVLFGNSFFLFVT